MFGVMDISATAMAVAPLASVSAQSRSPVSCETQQPLAVRPGLFPGRPGYAPVVWKAKRVPKSCNVQIRGSSLAKETGIDVTEWNKQVRDERLSILETQALNALRKTIENYQRPAFPCALITGDVVILDLLSRVGAFDDEKVKIIFIDTLHLFPETLTFLAAVEKRYGCKAHIFQAAGMANKQEYDEKYGSDLFIRDVDEYDRICKVEPFSRALKTLEVDAMVNGRRRDHGAERAHLEIFEGGDMAKVQPLAYWEFRDCWDYIEKYQLPYHPLHDQGYPSIGDMQSTLPVPKSQWFEYGGERSGRFQGIKNKDGSTKTECGIHAPTSR
ncbi:hypothetical protein MPTK1_6g04280 [Marchantia polymorpha subsp. ruderalis]|uniref:Phosphoadenosine phosphosulphate reductase domain-containing protein n=2 Tax=Marchantia polymorpha TaxID=3197 RepID=A0AAF6BNE8_MARPO|nr:hypothetical protein MARPO_0034s0092 [Marchantia polymorpha]PTQ41509.1 hypothetical protein MARPO_0034s0092 [Marchantia polymorpha]BBN13532.1 hypothetical protein Mp_6g04280 [Marchantia polymorpha subsp. ruderalis]BBN13533.1 hypothetical protein Mp_6g04280 [Marchantia polymorpha subsp. ruderalis]|eukprot:PTQ41507.1 hypothetical protein MARPO_0034s0092 [Marchantia polymorpha]